MCRTQINFALDFFQCVLFSYPTSHFTGRWYLRCHQDNSLEIVTSTVSKLAAQRTIDSTEELWGSDKHISERHGIRIRDNI